MTDPDPTTVREELAAIRPDADDRPGGIVTAAGSETIRLTTSIYIDDRDGRAVFSTGRDGEIGSCDRQAFLDAVAAEFNVVIVPVATSAEQLAGDGS
jgi:hypothetical protein